MLVVVVVVVVGDEDIASETSDRKTEIWGRGRSYGLKGDNTDRYMSEL